MIPDATAIADSATLLNASIDAYPLIAAVIAFVVILGFGVLFARSMRRITPSR